MFLHRDMPLLLGPGHPLEICCQAEAAEVFGIAPRRAEWRKDRSMTDVSKAIMKAKAQAKIALASAHETEYEQLIVEHMEKAGFRSDPRL